MHGKIFCINCRVIMRQCRCNSCEVRYEMCDNCKKLIEQNTTRYIPKAGDIVQHSKGGMYYILGISTHTETNEVTVVYGADGKIWNRPYDMFCDGRFKLKGIIDK